MYSIEIKLITREQVKSRNWRVTGKKPDGKEEYGYVDEETTEDVNRIIYTQKVEGLDIKRVIDAVNAGNVISDDPTNKE